MAVRIPGTARRAAVARFGRDPAVRLVGAGLCGPGGVLLWVRSDRPGPHVVRVDGPSGSRSATFEVSADPATDLTAVVRWPGAGAPPLEPGATFSFVVDSADGVRIGEGRFATPPVGPDDAPDTWSLAFGSCHQPFEDDGSERPVSLRMLEALEPAFDALGVRALLLLGDQMYTDLPRAHDLFRRRGFARHAPPGRRTLLDCTAAEVRALLQARYRTYFGVAPFRRLLAGFATGLVLDDHEVVDNFGTDPEHATARWAALREGALGAFHDYQGQRNHGPARPASSDLRFAWGPLAAFVLDLRTQRTADRERIRILSEPQWAALDRFLADERERPVLAVGLPVPLLHVPAWVVEAGKPFVPWGSGLHDRWSHPLACADRDRLVGVLRDHRKRHPTQKMLLLSGDVHVAAVSTLHLGDAPPVVQVVSSALSNLERAGIRHGSAAMDDLRPSFRCADGTLVEATLLPGIDGATSNPTTTLDAGVVTLDRSGPGWTVRVRVLGPPPTDGSPAEVVYDSGVW